jgi:hypothetical protein
LAICLASAWAPVQLLGLALGRGRFFSASTCLRLACVSGTAMLLGQEEIARVAGADFDLVAFGAEAVDGFEEENFVVSHDRNLV